jgi:cytochrome P450
VKSEEQQIDFGSPDVIADPYPHYRELRERAPASWLPLPGAAGGAWFLTRYADVSAVLRDARLSRNLRRTGAPGA